VPYGSLTVSQRQRTALPGVDFVTTFDDWLAVQNGALPGKEPVDPSPRYMRSLRDLCYHVHYDALYQAYLNACDAAGVHWRTDFVEGVLLGEQVAIDILEEQKASFNEEFTWTVTRFDGTTITI
jgi:hypothetical protein